MHRWLTISFGSTVCYLRWMSHILSDAEANSSSHVWRAIAAAPGSGRNSMAWRRDPRRVIVLFINRPWAHLDSSRCAGPRQGEAYDSVSQTNVHSCVKSIWVRLSRCFPKRDEIQWNLPCYTNPWAISQMEKRSSSWKHLKIDRPYGQYSFHMAKLVENSLMPSEMRKVPHPSYSPDRMSQHSLSLAAWSKLWWVCHYSMPRNFFRQLERFWMALKESHWLQFFESK
jgi:hypothetical protein